MREGLATASNDPSFSGESYANELMQLFIAPMHTDEQQEWASENELSSNAGASLMAFLMKDVNYSPEFLTGAADKVDEFERLAEDGPMGDASSWYYHTGISQFNESENAEAADPMAEMMRALSRQPEVGYDFITEGDRADFYFDKRDWSQDEYDGIAALADRVSTDPDVYGAHPEGAALVAAQFVDLTSNSEGFNAEDAKGASDSVAHLLSTYMPSTAAAMDGGGGDAGNAQNHPGGLNVIGFGQMDHMPQFYREDLVNMTGVAMSTEDGMVDMAGGVANYRQTQINTLADQLADDPDNINLRTQLQGVMLDDAELRAFTTKIAGETEINEAYNTDQQRQFWSNLVAEGVKQVPIKPPIVGSIVEHGIDMGTGAVNDAWANTAEGVTDEWEENATNGIAQMNYETYASLVESGVINENDVPPSLLDEQRRHQGVERPREPGGSFVVRRQRVAGNVGLHLRREPREHLPQPVRDDVREPGRRGKLGSHLVSPIKLVVAAAVLALGLSACGADNPPGTISEDDLPSSVEVDDVSHDDQAGQVTCSDVNDAEDNYLMTPSENYDKDRRAAVTYELSGSNFQTVSNSVWRVDDPDAVMERVSAGIDKCVEDQPDVYQRFDVPGYPDAVGYTEQGSPDQIADPPHPGAPRRPGRDRDREAPGRRRIRGPPGGPAEEGCGRLLGRPSGLTEDPRHAVEPGWSGPVFRSQLAADLRRCSHTRGTPDSSSQMVACPGVQAYGNHYI